MTRYKRTLYIGIGGAGINTLKFVKSKLKQAVLNEHGKDELPKQIQFLCIDTNTTDLSNLTEFTDDEKMCVSVRDPYGRYERERSSSTFEYIPEKNTQHILALDRGAGQVRSNGHFAIIESEFLGTMTRKLRTIANNIREVTIPGETMLVDTKIEIHMVFSLCGGTGSGMFLPVSALVREAIKNCEITGYMYSPTFFDQVVEDSARNMVVQNAYAAITELDYCMHFGGDRHIPVTYSFGPTRNDKITLKNRPFNEVMFVDKQTFAGVNGVMDYTYLNIQDAQELTAELLLLSATDALTAHIGVMDNVRQKVAQGQFNVRDKFGWVMGFGLSELYINGSYTLQKTAAEKAVEFLESFLKDRPDVVSDAYTWLNELGLNETGGEGDKDALINAIYNIKDKLSNFNLDDLGPQPSIDEWYLSVKGIDGSIEENKKEEIRQRISDAIRKDKMSFGQLSDLLKKLADKIEASWKQLNIEITGHKNELKKIGIIDYDNEPSRTKIEKHWYGNSKVENPDYKAEKAKFDQDSSLKISRYTELRTEIDRKESAMTILANLQSMVMREHREYKSRADKLRAIVLEGIKFKKSLSNDSEGEENTQIPRGKNRIDVTSYTSSLVAVNQITIDSLIDKLDDINCTDKELFEQIYKILLESMSGKTENSGSSQLLNIVDGFTNTSTVLKDLLKNSAPLLSMDFHGESLSVDEFIYIVGENSVANALKEKLEKMYPRRIEVIPLESMPYSVMLYRIVGAVPPYFVSGIADSTDPLSMEHTYEVMKTQNMTYTPYSHTMLQKMLENRYAVLKPYNELEDGKVMDAWINFILLGFIQRSENSGRYWIPSESCGERLSQELESQEKILKLGDDRATSFEMFRRHCSDLLEEYSNRYSQILEEIADIAEKEGKEAIIVDGKPNIISDYYFSKGEELADGQRGRSLTSRKERNKLRPGDVDFTLFEKEIAHINRRAQEYKTKTKAKSLDDEIISQNSKLNKD